MSKGASQSKDFIFSCRSKKILNLVQHCKVSRYVVVSVVTISFNVANVVDVDIAGVNVVVAVVAAHVVVAHAIATPQIG
jgi:hypothetical protein